MYSTNARMKQSRTRRIHTNSTQIYTVKESLGLQITPENISTKRVNFQSIWSLRILGICALISAASFTSFFWLQPFCPRPSSTSPLFNGTTKFHGCLCTSIHFEVLIFEEFHCCLCTSTHFDVLIFEEYLVPRVFTFN